MRDDPIYVECEHCGGAIRFVCTPSDFNRLVTERNTLEKELLEALRELEKRH